MNRNALIVAAGLCTLAQILLVLTGHFITFVADNLFAIGGVAISFVAGLIYARKAWPAVHPLLGGAASGAIGAFIGIALSWAMGDVSALVLPFGTIASAATGLGGAALGHGLAAQRTRS